MHFCLINKKTTPHSKQITSHTKLSIHSFIHSEDIYLNNFIEMYGHL